MANIAMNHLGYVEHETSDIAPEFWPAFRLAKPYTMTSLERMYAAWTAVRYVVENRIGGDVVECGVWRGGSAMVMASALRYYGDSDRAVHLFDTFTGMTAPTENDAPAVRERWQRDQREGYNEWCYAPLDEVRSNLDKTGHDNVVFVKGPVEATIPAEAPEVISVLRLDTDWFASTYHELVHLYDRVPVGGVVILDDYGHHAGARAAVDKFIAERDVPMLLSRVDYSGRVAVKVR